MQEQSDHIPKVDAGTTFNSLKLLSYHIITFYRIYLYITSICPNEYKYDTSQI